MEVDKIRNFSIIAHIDHGKSTLADRILEITNSVDKREMRDQLLDSMELEQERGITIKLNAVQLNYKDYTLHLIDTPGHVDFTYEVSRSLAACEGAILLVDATQGIQAQTISNVYLALEHKLRIIPVINKIDSPAADINQTTKQLIDLLDLKEEEILKISARKGTNITDVLEAVINLVPPPNVNAEGPLKALIFDSYFDPFRGVILLVSIKSGRINLGQEFSLLSNGKTFKVVEIGIKRPEEIKKDGLSAGEIGWIAASIRSAREVVVGDTLVEVDDKDSKPVIVYRRQLPVVFAGVFPINNEDSHALRDAIEKLSLSDSSISFTPESSTTLGLGYRVGFLGTLHLEIFQERLEREFGLNLLITAPTVEFKVELTDGREVLISNPSLLPDQTKIKQIFEPYVRTTTLVQEEFIGGIMKLFQEKRAIFIEMKLTMDRYRLTYDAPLIEIVFDFFDRLKSISKGFASFDYEDSIYQPSKMVRVDFLLNREKIDALSLICHRDLADAKARDLALRLKEIIPRHNFEIPIQAVIGAKIIARETIKAYRKDVTAKLYGGDVTRRQKLLKKQKLGKKRLKNFGKVQIPQEAFLSIMRLK